MKIKNVEIIQEDMDRFESRIFIVTEGDYIGCYETTYAKNGTGYYDFRIKGKNVLAHRLMYQIWHPDEDIDNLKICHRCDNPACVNPEHLFSGTSQDNINDRDGKDRQAKGSENGNSKLTEEDIVEMVNLTLSGFFTSCEIISKHYNVSNVMIYDIIKQKNWTHITKDFDMVEVKSLLDNNCNKGCRGFKNINAMFNDDQVRDIRSRSKNGESKKSLAKFYSVHESTIHKISSGKTYQSVV